MGGIRPRIIAQCPCGESFEKYHSKSRVYCSEFCAKRFCRRGVNYNPALGKLAKGRPKPGLRGRKQSEEHLIKRLGNGAIRASKEELSLIPVMTKLGFRHTGEGTFWRRWPDSTLHNPDFVNDEKRVVAEYFGAYWHDDDRGREEYIREQWKAVGYDCLILWSEDREEFIATGGAW